MLETGETFRKAAATLSVCRIDGETDSAFIGLYCGLLYVDKKYVEAQKIWDDAKELNFTDEDRTRRQFVPRDPVSGNKIRFTGTVVHTKPSYIIIQPDDGPTIISKTTVVNGKTLEKNQAVDFELSFSAKSPLADNVKLI
jgi:hypothetical protein